MTTYRIGVTGSGTIVHIVNEANNACGNGCVQLQNNES